MVSGDADDEVSVCTLSILLVSLGGHSAELLSLLDQGCGEGAIVSECLFGESDVPCHDPLSIDPAMDTMRAKSDEVHL